MTTESRKIQLETEVDATGARKGFEEIKSGAREMASAVSQAGQQAGAGMGAVGSGGDAAAQKLDRSTKSIIASIQRTTATMEAGERGSAKFYEALANQRGVNVDVLRPYLQQLDEVTKRQEAARASISNTGISAAQTAAAMRQVPAQFTDIITSLQGGQKPLTVLLQQGGQLKDMFGGAGAAASAMATYIAGLVTPVTLVAGALALIGGAGYLAWSQNRSEAQAFEMALIRTNGVLGVTSTELSKTADVLGSNGFARSAAASALAEMARGGDVAKESLKDFTQVALDMSKYVDQSVGDTVKIFGKLADEPVKASSELTKQMHYLSAAQLEQIRSLDDVGRKTDAARIAQQAYADAVKPTVDAYKANMGPLSAFMDIVTKKAVSMWDSLRGSNQTGESRIAALKQELADLAGPTPLKNASLKDALLGSFDESGVVARLKATKEAQLSYLQQVEAQTKKNTESQGAYQRAQDEANAVMDAVIKTQDKGLSKQDQMNKALDLYHDQVQKIKAANPDSMLVSAAAVARGEAAIREQYKSTEKANTELEKQARLINEMGGLRGDFTEQWNRLSAIYKAGGMNLEQLQAAQAKLLADQPAVKEQQRLYDEQAKAIAKSAAAYDQMVDATRKSADQLKTQADELEASNSMWGKGKVAVEEYRLAVIQAKLAEIDKNPDSYRSDYIVEKQRELAEQQRIVTQTQVKEYKTLLDKQTEWLRSAEEEAKLYEDEIGLLGLTSREREKVVAVRQVELRLAKEIAAINKSSNSDDPEAAKIKAQAIAQAQAAAGIAKQTAIAKADMNAMTDIINSVDRTAQQVWTNIWQGGSDVFTRLGQTIKASILDLLYQLTLKKWVIDITANILGSLGLSNAGSLVNGGSSGLNLLGSAGSVMSGSNILGSMYANATGTGIDGLLAANGAYGTAAGSSVLGSVAAAAPYVAAAIAAYKVLSSLDGGETRTGGQYAVAYDGNVTNNRRGETYNYVGQQYNRDNSLNPDGTRTKVTNGQAYLIEADGMGTGESATKKAVAATASGIDALLKDLGSSLSLKGFWAGLETSGNGRGGVFSGGMLSNGKQIGESGKGDNYSGTLYELTSTRSPDAATAMANFTLDLKQVTIQALQAASDIPQTIKDKLKDVDAEALTSEAADTLLTWITTQIKNVNSLATLANSLPLENLKNLSFDAASGLIELAGGIDTLSSQIDAYYKAYYSADEQRTQTLANIRKSLGTVGIDNMPTTLADYRKLVESQDLSTEAGRKTYAMLIALASAFADVTNASETAAAAAKKEADSKAQAEKDAAAAKAKADKDAAIAAANSAYSGLEAAITAQKSILQAQVQAAQTTINTIGSIMDTLKSAIDELYSSVATTQVQNQRQALAFIDEALATARAGGALPDGTKLSDAISAARSGMADSTGYKSLFEQQRAQLILAGKLSQLQDIAGTQKSIAQQQLDAANDQIDKLDKTLAYWKEATAIATGTWKATLSVVDAINALRDANSAATAATTTKPGVVVTNDGFATGGGGSKTPAAKPKSLREVYKSAYGWTDDDFLSWYANPLNHDSAEAEAKALGIPLMATGTNYVPRDMFAYLHQGEQVVPKAYNPAANGVLQSDGQTARLLASLIEEVRAMRASTERTASAVEGNQSVPLLVEIAS